MAFRCWVSVVAAFATVCVAFATPAGAAHGTADDQKNMSHLANLPKSGTTNSDLAFWGDLVYAGNYKGFRIIDASRPRDPEVLVDYPCNGPQNDVGVWDTGEQRLLFLSVDRRQLSSECSADDPTRATGWEGLRIFDVTDPRNPEFIKGVGTDCGSHTHTVVPARETPGGGYALDAQNPDRVFVYISSYPLTEHGVHHADDPDTESECLPNHFKESIVEVPFDAPGDARVTSELNTRTANGCHDVGVHLEAALAAAACLTEGQIWDISDPAHPVILNQLYNPDIEIWHSGSFTYDAKLAIFGDEEGGAAATHGCNNLTNQAPGAMWFYRLPIDDLLPFDSFTQKRGLQGIVCTAHNYNPIPGIGRDILTSSFYTAGTGIIDFGDLDGLLGNASPREIGYFDAKGIDGNSEADTWSSYWYNGLAYGNDINRGVDIFRFRGNATADAATLDHLNPQTLEPVGGDGDGEDD